MRRAVCDTSTLIRLRRGKALHCLAGLFERIYLPVGVRDECQDEELNRVVQRSPFEIHEVKNILPLGMGRGEREVLSLALELEIKTVLMDDKKGFRKAEQLGLKPMPTQNLLLLAKRSGIISSLKIVLDTMKANGESLPDSLYLKILSKAGEI